MQLKVAGIVLLRPLFGIHLPQCTYAFSSSSSLRFFFFSVWKNANVKCRFSIFIAFLPTFFSHFATEFSFFLIKKKNLKWASQ